MRGSLVLLVPVERGKRVVVVPVPGGERRVVVGRSKAAQGSSKLRLLCRCNT
jgi:hypothetical protein